MKAKKNGRPKKAINQKLLPKSIHISQAHYNHIVEQGFALSAYIRVLIEDDMRKLKGVGKHATK